MMSRSYKKAIIKNKGERNYHKIVRRVNKQIVKKIAQEHPEVAPLVWNEENQETYQPEFWNEDDGFYQLELEQKIKDPKVIVNDYDYCDYILDFENILTGEKNKQEKIKLKRK